MPDINYRSTRSGVFRSAFKLIKYPTSDSARAFANLLQPIWRFANRARVSLRLASIPELTRDMAYVAGEVGSQGAGPTYIIV